MKKLDKNRIGLTPCEKGKTMNPVSVIIPAYNEEASIQSQVKAIRQVLSSEEIPHEIIVVNDGSEDHTAQQAIFARANVLWHTENRGYGAAIKSGIMAAKYETIVIIDADGTYPPDQIPNLVNKLETADMVVGSRTGKDVHIPWLRQPAKWFLGWLATRIAGRPIPDLNSGMRTFRGECVKQYFPILSNQFSFTTTITLALLADDYHVVYHPINYYPRIGKSKIKSWHFMDFTILILRMAMLFQPLKIFIPLAFMCGLLGVLKVIYDIIAFFPRSSEIGWSLLYQAILSSSALFLLLSALQLLLIGMVADGVVRRIAQHNRPKAPSHVVCFSDSCAYSQVKDQVMTL